jgi:hypothetical protein
MDFRFENVRWIELSVDLTGDVESSDRAITASAFPVIGRIMFLRAVFCALFH